MSNFFTYFTVSLPFSFRDVSTAISNLLQMTTTRWRNGSHSMQTYHSGDPYVTRQMGNTFDREGR